MAITIGTHLGSVQITALLGRGGMGEVYRARDTKLKRDVAIKILPEEFSRDPDRVGRFQREAEVLASLNHPHIAAIYSLEEADGSRFLVLELVEGLTLADRLKRGQLPIEEALTISKRICEAIEAAHEKGIIHRDLKPANIKVTPDSIVKVLDFGLAKVREAEAQASDLSNSPTLMTARSAPGIILGTAAYMSPEQAKGQEANRTSDVWAFGCVLYEMLTGRPPFEGDTVSELVPGILKADPDWSRLPAETPENIRRLLRRCLHKDRRLRLQHIGDARVEIEEPQPQAAAVAPPVVPRRRERVWITAFVVATVLAVAMGIREFRGSPPVAEVRLEISTPPTADPASIAISPDGQKIVFVATSEGQSKLWVRPLDSVSGRALAGTDGASLPFWSPDSQSVGFFAEGKMKRIEVDRGAVQILADAPGGRGGAWNRDGTIIFYPNTTQSIYESSGHLFFVRQGTLFAQEFDMTRLEVKGNPFSIAERIATRSEAQGSAAVSASSVGPIIYRTASTGGRRQFLWLDRSGKEIGSAGDPLGANSLSLSRDGRRVALHQQINMPS